MLKVCIGALILYKCTTLTFIESLQLSKRNKWPFWGSWFKKYTILVSHLPYVFTWLDFTGNEDFLFLVLWHFTDSSQSILFNCKYLEIDQLMSDLRLSSCDPFARSERISVPCSEAKRRGRDHELPSISKTSPADTQQRLAQGKRCHYRSRGCQMRRHLPLTAPLQP